MYIRLFFLKRDKSLKKNNKIIIQDYKKLIRIFYLDTYLDIYLDR
jgi:hypothetical protein